MKRLTVLDGLRAIAVLIVMVSHAGLGHIVPGGFGVTIFFVLSGFLITTLMRIEWETKDSFSFRAFYLRRTVRIIPPVLICYAVTVLLVNAGGTERVLNTSGVVWDLLFLSNYAPQLGAESQIPIPLWSLNIEEHFYLAFPAIFLVLLKNGYQVRFLSICGMIALALALRFYELSNGNDYFIYYWTHTRYDAILFGVLLTVYLSRPSAKVSRWATSPVTFAVSIVAILSTFVIRDPLFRETFRYTIQGIGLFFVFLFLVEGKVKLFTQLLSMKMLKVVADYSYVLYLIHLPLLLAAEHLLPGLPLALRYAIGFVASFAFAAAMHRYVEQPLLRWRRSIEGGWQAEGAMRPKGLE